MKDNSDSSYDDPDDTPSQVKLVLAKVRKHRTIYASASALALAAALGTASLGLLPARAAGDTQAILQQKLPSFAPLVQKVKGAVVSIRVKANASANAAFSGESPFENGNPFEGTPFEKFFNGPNSPFRQFQERPGGEPRIAMAQGSGFFISPDGYLVTNNHVAANAVSLQIVTADGKTYTAKVIGTDPRTDLALLKVDGRNDFPYVKFSHSDVRVGDWVIAMGNPFGLGGTAPLARPGCQGAGNIRFIITPCSSNYLPPSCGT